MGTKNRPKAPEFESDLFDDYDDDDELDDDDNLSKDFYSSKREELSGSTKQMSVRRRIERRNELKELYSQIDDWNALDIAIDW